MTRTSRCNRKQWNCSLLMLGLVFCAALLLSVTEVQAQSDEADNDNNDTTTKYSYGKIQFVDLHSLDLLSNPNEEQGGEGDREIKELCMSFPTIFNLSTDSDEVIPYSIQDATTIDLCSNATIPIETTSSNTLLLLSASKCSIKDKLGYFEGKNLSGIIVISKIDSVYNIYENYSMDIFAVVKSEHASILKEPGVQVKLTKIKIDKEKNFDWSLVVLWVIAVFCVVLGGLTGPYQLMPAPPRPPRTVEQQTLEQPKILATAQRAASLDTVTVPVAITLVVFISTTLMLLYFFYQYLVYFFMAIFCIASARAAYFIMTQIFNYFVKHQFKTYWIITIPEMFFAAGGIALAVLWFIFRHSSWVWILQDILGICFCIHLIQVLQLPNMKVITILLSLLFIYDIFFVFITPYFTKDGKSVMVEVATGVSGSGSSESLPMLFKFPHLQYQAVVYLCKGKQYSMLGYGDVIVPGFLVCFAHVFDLRTNSTSICRPYFIASVIAYTLGLAGAFVALLLSSTGQPALLYIVPAVLLAIFSVGIYRKEVKYLWTGSLHNVEHGHGRIESDGNGDGEQYEHDEHSNA